jgi:hypothetical protein
VDDLTFEELLRILSVDYDTSAIGTQADLDGLIYNLQSQGVDVDALVSDDTSNVINAGVASLLTLMISRLVGATRQIAQTGFSTSQMQTADEDKLYGWMLQPTTSGKHCPDCVSRSQLQPRTMAEWKALGLPRNGATVCTDKCMCVLTEASK